MLLHCIGLVGGYDYHRSNYNDYNEQLVNEGLDLVLAYVGDALQKVRRDQFGNDSCPNGPSRGYLVLDTSDSFPESHPDIHLV
jgi:hypothetical protein